VCGDQLHFFLVHALGSDKLLLHSVFKLQGKYGLLKQNSQVSLNNHLILRQVFIPVPAEQLEGSSAGARPCT